MFLVVGLGNPGRQYQGTRHNIGFHVVDELVERSRPGGWRTERDAEVMRIALGSDEIVVVKPMTFMNRSGEAVSRLSRFFKLPLGRIIVVHDELDIPFGSFRVKLGGGDAGHNGLRSISQLLGGPAYYRVRVGIGRPLITQMAIADWVLGSFGPAESPLLGKVVSAAADVVEKLVGEGLQRAQQLASRGVVTVPLEGSSPSE